MIEINKLIKYLNGMNKIITITKLRARGLMIKLSVKNHISNDVEHRQDTIDTGSNI